MEKLTGPVLGTLPNLLNIAANTSGTYDWDWTWAVSAKKKVGKDWLLFASYGTYTRYPSFYEIYGDGLYVQAGADSLGRAAPLQREYGNNLDAGFGWNGTLVGDLTGTFRATYFRRKAFDAITFFNAPLGARYINSGTTLTQGGEFEGRLTWGSRADLQFGLTVQDGRYVKGTYYLYPAVSAAERVEGKLKTLQAPPVVANARLNLHFLAGALTTYGEVKYTGRNIIYQSRNGNSYETPLTTVDLGAHLALRHGIAISAGVNDVFNRGPHQKIRGSTANRGEYQFYKCNLADMIASDDYSCYYDPSSLVTYNYSWDQNVYYPQQGRTFYFTISKSFGTSDGKRADADSLDGASD